MKKNIFNLSVGFILGAILFSQPIAQAANNIFNVTAYNVKAYVDNKEINKNVQKGYYFNGEKYVPLAFLYEDTWYAPIKFIDENVNQQIYYKNGSFYIESENKVVPINGSNILDSTSLKGNISIDDLVMYNISPLSDFDTSVSRIQLKDMYLTKNRDHNNYMDSPYTNTSYIFNVYKNLDNKVNAISYFQFDDQAVNKVDIQTARGIKVGMNLSNVFEKYGKNYEQKVNKVDPWGNKSNVVISYAFNNTLNGKTIKGNFYFYATLLKGQKIEEAKIYGFEYGIVN